MQRYTIQGLDWMGLDGPSNGWYPGGVKYRAVHAANNSSSNIGKYIMHGAWTHSQTGQCSTVYITVHSKAG